MALTNTAGEAFARYTYDPYGTVLTQATNTVGAITAGLASAIGTRQPLRYAGYAYDAHSATYYLSQRHYDPATMRFLTKDPARDDGEESAYQYCAGDPVGKVDPTGEASSSSSWSAWTYLGIHRWFGGWASFEYRSRVTWTWLRPRISAKVEVEMRNGMAGGSAISVVTSRVRREARIRRGNGSEYDTTLGTLSYGIQPDPVTGEGRTFSRRSASWQSTTYSQYWIRRIHVRGLLQAVGGVSWSAAEASNSRWYYNPYGLTRPR